MAGALEAAATWKGRLLAAFCIVGAGGVLGGGAAWWVLDNRYGRELAELREQHASEGEAAAREQAALERKYRELEGAARDAIAAVVAHAAEERNREQVAAASARAEYLAGTRRLSLAVSSCAAAGGGAAADPAATGGTGQARAELAPEVAAALDAIAREGDQAIRDTNTCIDSYDAVRGALILTEEQ